MSPAVAGDVEAIGSGKDRRIVFGGARVQQHPVARAHGDLVGAISGTRTIQSLQYPECPKERSSTQTCVHPGDDVENPPHRKMIQVSCPAAWKPPVIVCAGL